MATGAIKETEQTVAEEEEISLLDVVLVLATRRRLIFRIALGTVMLGLIACFVLPSRYTATAVILPPQSGSSSSAMLAQLGSLAPMAALATGGGLSLKNPNDLQLAIMKSRTVEDAMIDRFHLMDLYHAKRRSDARKRFESRVALDSGTKDGLIHVSVTDANAQRAADLTNGYVDEYKKFTATLATTEASQRRLFFEQQLVGAKDDLATAEEALKATEQQTGLIQLDAQARAVIESVAVLRAQVAAKEVQIQAMKSFAAGENPELVELEDELGALKAQLAKQGAGSGGASGDLLMPKGSVPQAGLSYVRKVRDVKYRETIFDLLARQYEAAKLDEARQGAVVQIVDEAVVPDKRSFPKRTYTMLGALVGGILFGLVAALVVEGYARSTERPEDQARLSLIKEAWSAQRSKA